MNRDLLFQQFDNAINDCRRIYVDQAVQVVVAKSGLGGDQRSEFLDEVEFLFNRLLIKVFVVVAWSDCVWSAGEGELARKLVEYLLRVPVNDRDLIKTLDHCLEIHRQESWQSVLEPFTLLEELDESRPELEAGLMKMANIVAKIDGNVTNEAIGQLKNLKMQLHQLLTPPPKVSPSPTISREENGQIVELYDAFANCPEGSNANTLVHANVAASNAFTANSEPTTDATTVTQSACEHSEPTNDPKDRAQELSEAMAELDQLVGIDSIKDEVKGLVNFLKVQTARIEAGLPESPISLHMVFEGNPGTGKTTVARILGRIFGAMGVLDKGHLIETDRSGLVAEFVGQTAAKANTIIDSAIDGVLFIDEAYSLVNDAKDSFGAEAMQILLKRAEDNRDRLIVILAGYSEPMKQLLRSNPGLSSRFSRTFNFPDYKSAELIEIFRLLSERNHYIITEAVERKLLTIVKKAVFKKDEHFGNGRLMRNVFESAIRKLADRVVDIKELTPELLTTFEESDLA